MGLKLCSMYISYTSIQQITYLFPSLRPRLEQEIKWLKDRCPCETDNLIMIKWVDGGIRFHFEMLAFCC